MKLARLFCFLFAVLALWCGIAYAQDPSASISPELLTKPFKEWQLNLTTVFLVAMLLGRAYNGLRTRGGLVGAWRGLLFGENLPTTIAKDYSVELGNKLNDPPKPHNGTPIASLLLLLTLGAVAVTTFTGCNTPTATADAKWNAATIARVSGVVQASTTVATASLVISKPDTAPIISAVADAILAASDSTYDPAALNAIVLKAAGDTEYSGAITGAFTLALGVYQTFYAINVENALDSRPAFKAVLIAIAQGAKIGAGGSAASSAEAQPIENLSLREMQLR